MSIKVAKIKNYLKETYQKLGEVFYSYYWNQGYINCLNDEGKIDEIELAKLTSYNNILYFEESKKIGDLLKESRKIPIKKEELKEMELERIKKRIDESIQIVCEQLICRDNNFTTRGNCFRIMNEAKKTLNIYKELIEEYEKTRNPIYDIGITIKRLEDKYYPQPLTFRQKIKVIINKDYDGSIVMMRGELTRALEDGLPEVHTKKAVLVPKVKKIFMVEVAADNDEIIKSFRILLDKYLKNSVGKTAYIKEG